MQLFPERLGDNDAARFVDGEAAIHSGMKLWVDPLISTIVQLCADEAGRWLTKQIPLRVSN
jgi:hypothetical protein